MKVSFFIIIVLFTLNYNAQTHLSKTEINKAEEYLLLNSGDKIWGNIKFFSSNKSSYINLNYFILNDTIRYEGRDVKAFSTSDGYFAKLHQSRDYVKRDIVGNINLYSEAKYKLTYEYYSKDGGDVLVADYDNLRESLRDNPQSLMLLEQARTYNNIKYVFGTIGLGIMVSSFIGKEHLNNPDISTAAIGGAILTFGYWIPTVLRKEKIVESIKVYNGLR